MTTTAGKLDILIAAAHDAMLNVASDLYVLAEELDPTADPPPPALTDEQKARLHDIVVTLTDIEFTGSVEALSDAIGDWEPPDS